MLKYKLKKFINLVDDEYAELLYEKYKEEIEEKLKPKLVCGIGTNSANKVLERKTYFWWIKFLKSGKEIHSKFTDYVGFHEWVITQHGYGQDGMSLSCISNTDISPETLFFLPNNLSIVIRPENLEKKGIRVYNNRYGKSYAAYVDRKCHGVFDNREEAQLKARNVMLERIKALTDELQHLISKDAYNAIQSL